MRADTLRTIPTDLRVRDRLDSRLPIEIPDSFQQSLGPNARYQITGAYLELPSTNCLPCVVTLDAKFFNENNIPAGRGEFMVFISGSGINASTPVFIGKPEIFP